MRTHIRMHFDKKSSDFNEEHYISCIVEDDGLEHQVPPVATTAGPSAPNTQNSQHDGNSSTLMHNCDKCNYSSSYKGNVVSYPPFFIYGSICFRMRVF